MAESVELKCMHKPHKIYIKVKVCALCPVKRPKIMPEINDSKEQ